MNSDNIFIGVAWPYVNGDLHVGHLAGYLVPADITARFFRSRGKSVLMVSGSDSHGTPITVEADKKEVSPQKIVDIYHQEHKKLFDLFGLSFDIFTKTTTDNHKKVVQDIFVKLAEKGYIIKKKSQQFYSERKEKFLPDRYVEGECPNCGCKQARGDQCDKCGHLLEPEDLINPKSKLGGEKVILKETEHYYLDLPKFHSFLEKYVKEKGVQWRDWIYKETQGWLEKGLQQRCITRDLEWGIKIPVDRLPTDLQSQDIEGKRIYVWFEAVIGYLSASIEWDQKKWRDFWYNDNSTHYYFMGKDNLAFHSLFWPSQLHGYDKDIHLPDQLVINHFLNVEQKQLSKSRNVIIDSRYVGETYGVDATRFYVTLINPEKSDASFSWEHFVEVKNNILIGTIGNFINRVLKITPDSFDKFKTKIDPEVRKKVNQYLNEAAANIKSSQLRSYVRSVIKLAEYGNQYFSEKKPWSLDKKKAEFKEVITQTILIILAINLAWRPLMPNSFQKLNSILGISIEEWPEKKTVSYLKKILKKVNINNVKPLFEKISPDIIDEERSKLDL